MSHLPGVKTGTCSTCGAKILWVRSATNGKPMPLDPEQVVGGNVSVAVMRGDALATAKVLWNDPKRVAYVSHFATCPNAAEHRRAR